MDRKKSSTHAVASRQDIFLPESTIDEIRQLVAVGKCKQAVELAKDRHKREGTAESQRLLVETYVARIQQFQSKGMVQEAQTLLKLVGERFPAERHQLDALEIFAAAAAGRFHDLLAPLKSDQTSPTTRTMIENAVANQIIDLPAIASCDVLPSDHPLRIGAGAVWKAFLAATSGNVSDELIALPEISRRSPLASWKMLIRAIAAFYRRDDEGCRRALDSVAAAAAVAPAAAALRSMVDGTRPSVGIATVLHSRALPDDRQLRMALEKIETSFRYHDLGRLLAGVREAVRLCAAIRPELLDRLKQQISAACLINELPAGELRSALGVVPRTAHFWRLLAQANISCGPSALSALFWERFLRHSIAEASFEESSPQAAAVWLEIAQRLSRRSLEDLQDDRSAILDDAILSSYYENQAPEIARLKPGSEARLVDFLLEPGQAFRQAARIRPKRETFEKWWAYAQRIDLPDKSKEDVALAWRQALPGEAQPLVHLALLAESRNALSLAIKRLSEAEAVDPMNQQVRHARVRLTLSIAWRHFGDRKPHLVEKDLADLAALPSMNEGDHATVLEAMRGACHALRKDPAAEKASYERVLQNAGPLVGLVVFDSIKVMALQVKLRDVLMMDTSSHSGLDLARAQARIIRLASDLNLNLYRPADWEAPVLETLRQTPCPLSNHDILFIGKGGLAQKQYELAYCSTSAGLARADSPASIARFLLVRAISFVQTWRLDRAMQCLRAALELARQAHDQELINEIFELVDDSHKAISMPPAGRETSPDTLRAIIDNEKRAVEFPRTGQAASKFVVDDPEEAEHPGGFGGYGSPDSEWDGGHAGEQEDEDADEEAEDLFSADSPGLFDPVDSPPSLDDRQMQELMEMMAGSGINSPQDLMNHPEGLVDAMVKSLGRKISKAEKQALVSSLFTMLEQSGFKSGKPKKSGGRK